MKKTDLPLETKPPGVTASPDVEAPILESQDGNWVGSFANRFADTFLRSKKKEFETFQEHESAKLLCAPQFRDLVNGITERRQALDALRAKVSYYQNVNIAKSVFNNMRGTVMPLEAVAGNPIFFVAVILKESGEELVQLAEADLAAYEKTFAEFKEENKAILHEVGLL